MSGYTPPSYCVSLTGSALCPAFVGQYINPTNLTQAWPFFSNGASLPPLAVPFPPPLLWSTAASDAGRG